MNKSTPVSLVRSPASHGGLTAATTALGSNLNQGLGDHKARDSRFKCVPEERDKDSFVQRLLRGEKSIQIELSPYARDGVRLLDPAYNGVNEWVALPNNTCAETTRVRFLFTAL